MYVPVRQQEGADVWHRWGGGSHLSQSHDVLKGDVRLSAHIHHAHFL